MSRKEKEAGLSSGLARLIFDVTDKNHEFWKKKVFGVWRFSVIQVIVF